MDGLESEAPTVQQLLSDALFNGKLKHVIIVALDEDDTMCVWHSYEKAMWFVGLLEAAQQQLLGLSPTGMAEEEDDDDVEA
jgi:hypothetical protein